MAEAFDEGRSDLVVRLGLFVAILLLIAPGTPPTDWVLVVIGLVAVLGLSLLRPVGPLAVLALLAAGVLLRASLPGGGSDVLAVTVAAARETLAGGSPYGHGFGASIPPGAPFAYGPVALAWYLPSLDLPGRMELLASWVVLGALAFRGRILGLAVYAVMPALLVAATDGSNDTSAGLLILVSLLAAVRVPLAGAALLGVAVAFKPYALAWLPGLLVYAASLAPLIAFIAVSLIVWVPAVLAWGLDSIAWSLRRAEGVHAAPYYSLAYALRGRVSLDPATWGLLRYGSGLVLAIASLPLVRTDRSVMVVGIFVFLATLFLGWWSSFAYLAAVAPVVCWHLDDWLGLGRWRVRWPGDPAGVLSDRVDARWPIRRPAGGTNGARGGSLPG